MSQTERLYRLKSLLDGGRCVARKTLLTELAVSPATLKRDLAHLRDRMNAPLVHDRERGGYRLDPGQALAGRQYELPGLWLSAEEIHALLTMQHLLANLDAGGLLGPHIAPLLTRLGKLLDSGAPSHAEIARRIRVQTVGARRVQVPHFQAVGSALLRRQRLQISYHGRGRNLVQDREVSPQRLIHYRDNWYLDAWCHWRGALRSFAVDAMQTAQIVDRPAIDVPDAELDAVLGAGYGIFAGREVQWATLRFSPERARWVAAETWHPGQRGSFEPDGHYRLELPYADPRELVMDILRHVPHVRVVGPAGLREEVREKLVAGLAGLTL
jgi:predicted DNA-binding transcriptional regulator YafY